MHQVYWSFVLFVDTPEKLVVCMNLIYICIYIWHERMLEMVWLARARALRSTIARQNGDVY